MFVTAKRKCRSTLQRRETHGFLKKEAAALVGIGVIEYLKHISAIKTADPTQVLVWIRYSTN